MLKNLRWSLIGAGSLMFVFLMALAVQGFTAQPGTSGDRIGLQTAQVEKEPTDRPSGDRPARPTTPNMPDVPCPPGANCVNHVARAGDTAAGGSACTSGTVCNSPGPGKCGPGNMGACQTTQLGGGNCQCQCILQ